LVSFNLLKERYKYTGLITPWGETLKYSRYSVTVPEGE
jgi:hypothetical protein